MRSKTSPAAVARTAIGDNDEVTTETSDPGAEWWMTSDVAADLGVGVAAVSAYRKRGQMPAPDSTVGRTHMWRPARVREWHAGRPRPGVGGRPPGSQRANEPGGPTPAESNGGSPEGDAIVDDRNSEWLVHGQRTPYDNEWIRLYKTDVELPDGQRFEHHTLWLPTAAMTALLDDDETHVLLMWRHRFVSDVWNWELPGGLVDQGEEPADAAVREIEEETGYRARTLEHLVTFEPMIGMVNSPHHVFLGRGATRIGEPTETTEMHRMEWVPLADVPQLIADGLIRNSGTLVALLHVLAISAPVARSR
jgi:8-oxo-dGTP pyrophosphatase MutT (NUDIX family)